MSDLLAALTPTPVPQNLDINSIWVAVVALIHQQYATFLTGAASLALVSEGIATLRNDPRHARLSEGIVKAMAYLFSFGAALPIFWVLFVLLGLWGTFFVALTRITWWVFVLEAGMFLVEIILLYGLYANWQRLGRFRTARLGLLVLLNITLFWQFFLIDVVASYMLTPSGGDRSQLAQILNPTDLPLTIHRTVGNIAWAGALVAGFAAVRLRSSIRHEARLAAHQAAMGAPGLVHARSVGAMAATPELPGSTRSVWFRDDGRGGGSEPRPGTRPGDRAFYDFVVQWGVLFAIGFTLLQPWVGYSYAKEVQLHSYPAWASMMWGELSNFFLLQITLLGAIFTIGAFFFLHRLRASLSSRGTVRIARVTAYGLLLTTVFAAIPARFSWTLQDIQASGQDSPWWQGGLNNPIGTFIPNKVIALLLFMMLGVVALTAYLTAVSQNRMRWGDGTRGTAALAIALTAMVSLMMADMGFIREHARRPYLIYGEMTLSGQAIVSTPPSQGGAIPAHDVRAPTRAPQPPGRTP